MIRGYVALLDQRKLGLQVTAYVSVRMEKQPDQDRHEFHQCVADEPYIIECHAMSGGFDFLMKVVARDMDHFAEHLTKKLKYKPVETVWHSPFGVDLQKAGLSQQQVAFVRMMIKLQQAAMEAQAASQPAAPKVVPPKKVPAP